MRPNFFVVGTTKGGTSSLDLWLRQHDGVGTPSRKEMHFFCTCPNPRLRVADSMTNYLDSFPTGEAVGESSPCYLYYPDIPERLAEFEGARIIVSLRDPAERFWSHYLMNEIYRPSGMAPDELLNENLARGRSNALEDLFGMGLYGEQVARYRESFGDRLKVLFLEETTSDPGGTMAEVFEFLGLPQQNVDTSIRDKEHVEPRGVLGELTLRNRSARAMGNALLPAAARRFLKTRVLGDASAKPKLDDVLRARLRTLYAEDSRRLESLLGRGLPWDWHR